MDAPLPVAGTVVLLREAPHGPEVLLIRRPDRGSFAGGWVFPGGVVEERDRGAGASEEADARAAAIRETREEVGLQVSDLVALSRWSPPLEAPKRVRTWFFLARDPGGAVAAAPDEVADWCWLRPADALARHAAGEIELFPPTWVTLHGLSTGAGVEAALAAASAPAFFSTWVLPGEGGPSFLWEGDAEHPAGGAREGRHRLETGPRPWRYIRS